MKKNGKTYSISQKASAIFMILALCWLTISTPFIVSFQQELAKQECKSNIKSAFSGTEEESSNPFGNNTEEKAPASGANFSEEYLHDQHSTHYFFSQILQYYKCENADTYIAFHGELLVPPPNAA